MEPHEVVRAERELQQARLAFASGERQRCEERVRRGLALVAGSRSPLEAALLVQLAQVLAWDVDQAKSLQAAQAAAEMTRRAGASRAAAELVLAQALYVANDASCLAHSTAAAEAAAREGDLEVELEARSLIAAELFGRGRADDAVRLASALNDYASAHGKRAWIHLSAWMLARMEWLASGDVGRGLPALRSLAGARSLGLHGPQLLGDYALALADAGEIDDARRAIARAQRAAGTRWTTGVSAYYRAEIAWASGHAARTLAAAEAALATGLPDIIDVALRSTRMWALFELGTPEGDAALEGRETLPLVSATIIEGRAFKALAAGDGEAAERLLAAAAEGWHGKLARNELRARWGEAELALRRNDVRSAGTMLRALEARAESLGVVPILARVRASLDRLPARLPRPSRGQGLSARQRDALALVGAGLTTPEIAARLGLSRWTIDSHVASAMAKLGARTRLEAAARAGARSGTGTVPLPAEAVDLLRLLRAGLSVAEAAAAVGVSRRTASRRLAAARTALAVRSNAQAAARVP